jgi:hypothetical protein
MTKSRAEVIEQTEKAMQYSEMPCASCGGTGVHLGSLDLKHFKVELPPDNKCTVCSGSGVVRFKRKNMTLEPIGDIIESNPLKQVAVKELEAWQDDREK